jgi:hypothetical protein
VLSSAIDHYVLKGNLRRAATQQQYLAELYEVELGDMKKALESYEKAAEWFEGDNAEAYDSYELVDMGKFQPIQLTSTLSLVLQTNTTSRLQTWLHWTATTTRLLPTLSVSVGPLLTTI